MIIGARVRSDQADVEQPTWLAWLRYHRRDYTQLVHTRTTSPLHALRPGPYALHHMDFGRSSHSGYKTVGLPKVRDQLSPDEVYYYGTVYFHRPAGPHGRFTAEHELDLLSEGCRSLPPSLQSQPIQIIGPLRANPWKAVSCSEWLESIAPLPGGD